MANNESIGGISVSISIDLNDFQGQLDKAVSLAEQSGAKIGSGLSAGSSQVDALSKSIGTLTTQLQQAGTAMTTSAGNAAELSGAFTGFSGAGLAIAGMATAVVELGKDAVEAFANLDRATVSLAALTGSADQAGREIASLKILAQDDALSFPELLQANQRLTALGVSASQIPAALRAAADGAAAMNTSLINVTNAIDRMAASGSVAGRNLTQLGLTTNDLASVMGVSLSQLSKAFHDLDESDRIDALTQALEKFDGVAAARADSITGSFQKLENSATFALQSIGSALAPAAKGFADFATSAIQHLQDTSVAFENWLHGLKQSPEDIENLRNKTFLLSQELGEMGVVVKQGSMTIEQWHDALMDAAKALDAQGPKLTPVQKGLEALTQKQEDANKAVDSSKAILAAAAAALDGSAEKAMVYQRALAAYDDAQKKANIGTKDFQNTVAGLTEAYNKSQNTISTLQASYAQLLASQDGTERSADLLAEAHKRLTDAENKLMETAKQVTPAIQGQGKAFDNLATSADAFMLKETGAAAAAAQAKAVLDQLAASSDTGAIHQRALADAVDQYSQKLKDAGLSQDKLIQFQLNGVTVTAKVSDALKTLKESIDTSDHGITKFGDDTSKVFTQFQTDAETGEKSAQKFFGTVDEGTKSVTGLTDQISSEGTAMEDAAAKGGDLVKVLKGLSDSANQITGSFSNSAAILERNAQAIQKLVDAASHGVVANHALQAAYEKTNADVSQGVSVHGQLSDAAAKVASNFSNLSATEIALASNTVNLNSDLDTTTNTFRSMTNAMTDVSHVMDGLTDSFQGMTISAMDWWAAAATFSGLPSAITSPQEGSNGEGSPGWFIDQISAMEDAFINASGLKSTTRAKGQSLSDWKKGILPGSSSSSNLTSSSSATGSGISISGGPLQIDPVTGEPVSSGGITLSDLTQSLVAGQTATAQSIANLSTSTTAITNAVDSTSAGFNVLNDAITSIGSTATQAGTALLNTSGITQAAVDATATAVQAQSALINQVQAFLDTPAGTAITNPSSSQVTNTSPEAYASIGSSKLGGGQQGGLTVNIMNPVVTSQMQADQMMSQVVNVLRNQVGLKI